MPAEMLGQEGPGAVSDQQLCDRPSLPVPLVTSLTYGHSWLSPHVSHEVTPHLQRLLPCEL